MRKVRATLIVLGLCSLVISVMALTRPLWQEQWDQLTGEPCDEFATMTYVSELTPDQQYFVQPEAIRYVHGAPMIYAGDLVDSCQSPEETVMLVQTLGGYDAVVSEDLLLKLYEQDDIVNPLPDSEYVELTLWPEDRYA